MAGTRHFARMTYSVTRGLREIVAPNQTMSKKDWASLKEEFGNKCAYCGQGETRENRGIVPDHLIPVTSFGELVLGNTIPACQSCNDSRGDRCWREFLKSKFSEFSNERITIIEKHIDRYGYNPSKPDEMFTSEELEVYNNLHKSWHELLNHAKKLQLIAMEKRKLSK